jgi:hypothetical protein
MEESAALHYYQNFAIAADYPASGNPRQSPGLAAGTPITIAA